MTHALQMLMISAKYHPLNDEATSMLIDYLNRDLLEGTTRAHVINACQKSCDLRMSPAGIFYKG